MGVTPEDFPTGAGNFEAVCPETFVNGNLGHRLGDGGLDLFLEDSAP